MEEAEKANNTNDAFLLVSLIFSIAIFFLSMSLSSEQISVKKYFFILGMLISLVGLLYLISLPFPF
jgi:predicted transporter